MPYGSRAPSRTASLFGLSRWLLFLMLVFFARPGAAVQQPDGTIVPIIANPMGACTSGLNVQACLNDSEVSLGGVAGVVGAIANATINQETFNPGCQLTFKVLSKGGSRYGHAFGWYETRPGNVPPALSDLHVFLTCADGQMPGLTKILTLPAGVKNIGFFMASYSSGCGMVAANGTLAEEPLYTFYTERRYNGLNRAGAAIPTISRNVIRVLTWQSSAEPGSFYFGWEDDGQTSDDNFNDLVTRVGGIACNGGGATCDTGLKGACAAGTLQCRAGALTCVADQDPIAEICNAVDDNCDGVVDEGDDICPQNFVCSRGTCVHKCTDSEFYPCPIGFTCDSAGVCIETPCQGVNCPPGQLCRGGQCRAECDGIVCPHGQACRRGGCVDVCSGLKCDENFACVVQSGAAGQGPVGVCTTCSCKGCPTGTTCVDNACRPSDCAAVTCAPGTHCQGGMCLDSCAGAKCPSGTLCKQGQCVSDGIPRPDAGVGVPVISDASVPGTETDTGKGNAATDAGRTGPGLQRQPGCGCNTTGDWDIWDAMLAVAVVMVLEPLRRRRRGRGRGR